MQKGGPCHCRIGQKAPVHHHRIMGGIGKDLQKRHRQQHPAVPRAGGAWRGQHGTKIEGRGRDQRRKGQPEHDEENPHLDDIRAQRRRKPAPCGIGKPQRRDDDDGRRAAADKCRVENQPDHQQVGENLGQKAQGDHGVVAAVARRAEARADPVLYRPRALCPQACDNETAGQEGAVIGGIGQRSGDAVVIAEDGRVHQAAREDPRRHLTEDKNPEARRTTVGPGPAEKALDARAARGGQQAGKDDGTENGEKDG